MFDSAARGRWCSGESLRRDLVVLRFGHGATRRLTLVWSEDRRADLWHAAGGGRINRGTRESPRWEEGFDAWLDAEGKGAWRDGGRPKQLLQPGVLPRPIE